MKLATDKKFILCLMAILLLITIYACAEQPVSTITKQNPSSSKQPQYGGVLRVSDGTDGTGIGYPAGMIIWAQRQVQPAIEPILRVGTEGQPTPWLASAFKEDASAKAITLTLRDGVKFHDGTAFNADAVKWNLELCMSAKTAGTSKFKSIEALDERTVRINLTEWDSTIISGLTGNIGMMISPAAYKQNGKDWAMANPVGTGPFKFVSWNKEVKTTYTKFDGYWQKGKPYLDSIEWIPIKDPVTRLMSFRKKEIDLAMSIDPKDFASLRSEGYVITGHSVGSGARSLSLDSATASSPFANIKVRQAVQYAIDCKSMVDSILAGWGEVTNQYGYKEHWGFNSSVVGYPYNPTKAKQLLAEAGYPNGFKTKLMYSITSGPNELFTAVQGFLSKVGIDAEVDAAPAARWMQSALQGGGWEGIILCGAQTSPDLTASLANRLSGGGMMYNKMMIPDDYLKAVQSAVAASDFETKKKWTQEATKLMIDKYCLLTILYAQREPAVSQPYLHDHGFCSTADTAIYTPSEAWMEPH